MNCSNTPLLVLVSCILVAVAASTPSFVTAQYEPLSYSSCLPNTNPNSNYDILAINSFTAYSSVNEQNQIGLTTQLGFTSSASEGQQITSGTYTVTESEYFPNGGSRPSESYTGSLSQLTSLPIRVNSSGFLTQNFILSPGALTNFTISVEDENQQEILCINFLWDVTPFASCLPAYEGENAPLVITGLTTSVTPIGGPVYTLNAVISYNSTQTIQGGTFLVNSSTCLGSFPIDGQLSQWASLPIQNGATSSFTATMTLYTGNSAVMIQAYDMNGQQLMCVEFQSVYGECSVAKEEEVEKKSIAPTATTSKHHNKKHQKRRSYPLLAPIAAASSTSPSSPPPFTTTTTTYDVSFNNSCNMNGSSSYFPQFLNITSITSVPTGYKNGKTIFTFTIEFVSQIDLVITGSMQYLYDSLQQGWEIGRLGSLSQLFTTTTTAAAVAQPDGTSLSIGESGQMIMKGVEFVSDRPFAGFGNFGANVNDENGDEEINLFCIVFTYPFTPQ